MMINQWIWARNQWKMTLDRRLPGLVNVSTELTNWKISMLFSWVNQMGKSTINVIEEISSYLDVTLSHV